MNPKKQFSNIIFVYLPGFETAQEQRRAEMYWRPRQIDQDQDSGMEILPFNLFS